MIRIFLAILAVVAGVLGYILQQPILYAAAGLLVLIAGIQVFVERRRKYAAALHQAQQAQEDDLNALGILEIRPKTTPRPQPAGRPQPIAPPDAEPVAESEPEPAPTASSSPQPDAMPPSPHPEPGTPSAPPTDQAAPSSPPAATKPAPKAAAVPAHRQRTQVLEPYLQTLQGAMEVHTACLLKVDGDQTYRVEAVASRSAYARSTGNFSTQAPLPVAPAATVQVLRAGQLPAGSLNYYREPVPVREVALLPLILPDDTAHLLLVDTLKEGDLQAEDRRALLRRFGELLTALLAPETLVPEPEPEAPAAPPAEPAEDEETPEDEASAEDVRPRRDIIAEEMDEARAAGHTLALALIHRNDAEAIAAEGPDAVADAEEALADYLGTSIPDSRVERFGELTYGAFFQGTLADVEAWAVRLQEAFAPDPDGAPPAVSIGIALLQDRHQSPDLLRADATAALREAYETGTCTILE